MDTAPDIGHCSSKAVSRTSSRLLRLDLLRPFGIALSHLFEPIRRQALNPTVNVDGIRLDYCAANTSSPTFAAWLVSTLVLTGTLASNAYPPTFGRNCPAN